MVGRRELPNAVALNSSLFNASRILGPAAGGAIIAVAGVGFCFAVQRRELPRRPRRPARDAREGLAYARASRRVLLTLVVVLVLSTFCFPVGERLARRRVEDLHAPLERGDRVDVPGPSHPGERNGGERRGEQHRRGLSY